MVEKKNNNNNNELYLKMEHPLNNKQNMLVKYGFNNSYKYEKIFPKFELIEYIYYLRQVVIKKNEIIKLLKIIKIDYLKSIQELQKTVKKKDFVPEWEKRCNVSEEFEKSLGHNNDGYLVTKEIMFEEIGIQFYEPDFWLRPFLTAEEYYSFKNKNDYANILEFETTDSDAGIFPKLYSSEYHYFMKNIFFLYIFLNQEDLKKYSKHCEFAGISINPLPSKVYKNFLENSGLEKLWDMEGLKILQKYFKDRGYMNSKTKKIEFCFQGEKFYKYDYLNPESYDYLKNIDSFKFYKSTNYYINKLDELENQVNKLGKDMNNLINYELVKSLGYDSWSKIVLSNMGFYYKPISKENLKVYKMNGFSKEDSRLLNLGDICSNNFTKDEYLVKLEYKNYIEAKSAIKFEFSKKYSGNFNSLFSYFQNNTINSLKKDYLKVTLETLNSIKLVIDVQIEETIEDIIWQYLLIMCLNSYRVSFSSNEFISYIKKELIKEGLKKKFINGGNILFIINSSLLINYSELSQNWRSNYWYKQINKLEKKFNEINNRILNNFPLTKIEENILLNNLNDYYKNDIDGIIKYKKNENNENYLIDFLNLNTKFVIPIYKAYGNNLYSLINNGNCILDTYGYKKSALKITLNYSENVSYVNILNEYHYGCFNLENLAVWSNEFSNIMYKSYKPIL